MERVPKNASQQLFDKLCKLYCLQFQVGNCEIVHVVYLFCVCCSCCIFVCTFCY